MKMVEITPTTSRLNALKTGDIFRLSNGSAWKQVIAISGGRIEYCRHQRGWNGRTYLVKEKETLPAASQMIVEVRI